MSSRTGFDCAITCLMPLRGKTWSNSGKTTTLINILAIRVSLLAETSNQTQPDSISTSWFTSDNSALVFVIGVLALACGYLGMGLPQHYYQPLFAALVLTLGWRHGAIDVPQSGWRWPLVIVMFLILSMMFKLLIGGGTSHPFAWLKVPVFEIVEPAEKAGWFEKVVPRIEMNFKGIPHLSDWTINITKIQTLFLVATLIGAMVRFQPFASLTAVALLIISIPTLATFNWDWVLPFLILGAATFYLRSPSGLNPRRQRPDP